MSKSKISETFIKIGIGIIRDENKFISCGIGIKYPNHICIKQLDLQIPFDLLNKKVEIYVKVFTN